MNTRKNYLWNLIFSVVNAAQSTILLLMVNRILGERSAGVFAYAFSVAVLFFYVGNFGIRNFQVSDTKEKYSFSLYYGFRVITGILMLISVGVYLIIKGINGEKALVIVSLCFERLVEAIEDVFHGRYQQKGDLFLSGFQGTVRLLLSDLLFFGGLFVTKNLVLSCMLFTITNAVAMLFMTMRSINNYGGFTVSFSKEKIVGLFTESFALFGGYFLSTYLCNVCKYSLDKYANSESQAYFCMIFTPVLVINLLSTVIFRPIIVSLADWYNCNEIEKYQKNVKRQENIILILGVLIISVSYFFGIPVLSWFYGSNLDSYRVPFMFLMIGGMFSAFSSFLNVCIITIRKQGVLLVFSVIISMIAACLTDYFVKTMGIRGAAYAYQTVMILQAVCYFVLHSYEIYKFEH